MDDAFESRASLFSCLLSVLDTLGQEKEVEEESESEYVEITSDLTSLF